MGAVSVGGVPVASCFRRSCSAGQDDKGVRPRVRSCAECALFQRLRVLKHWKSAHSRDAHMGDVRSRGARTRGMLTREVRARGMLARGMLTRGAFVCGALARGVRTRGIRSKGARRPLGRRYPMRQPFTVVCMMSRRSWRMLGGHERKSLSAWSSSAVRAS